jgi:hypothetical protein
MQNVGNGRTDITASLSHLPKNQEDSSEDDLNYSRNVKNENVYNFGVSIVLCFMTMQNILSIL